MGTVGCATPATAPSTAAQASADIRDPAILARASQVADWQLAHMSDFSYVSTFRDHTEDPRDWIQATFYIGLSAFADATSNPIYAEAVETLGWTEGWSFGPRPRHADADAIGQVWVWSAGRSEGEDRVRRLAPIRQRFDAVIAAPSSVAMTFGDERGERACQVRWCWSDALFMAPPAWAGLTAITGDERYFAHADREFQATVDALYDADEHLFYRDSRFIGQVGPTGKKVFWSRGNGWSYAGIARVLQWMPADHPRRGAYENLFRQMSARLVQLQGADGYWPVSLLVPGGPPETSGTGFFVYGMAWGVNEGLLPADRYAPAVARGWAALDRAVGDDGRLGWVQQVGYAPDRVEATDTQLYGTGAYLLAASQVARRANW
jgi:rhamnogalacturonyl hydrolase YesR